MKKVQNCENTWIALRVRMNKAPNWKSIRYIISEHHRSNSKYICSIMDALEDIWLHGSSASIGVYVFHLRQSPVYLVQFSSVAIVTPSGGSAGLRCPFNLEQFTIVPPGTDPSPPPPLPPSDTVERVSVASECRSQSVFISSSLPDLEGNRRSRDI